MHRFFDGSSAFKNEAASLRQRWVVTWRREVLVEKATLSGFAADARFQQEPFKGPQLRLIFRTLNGIKIGSHWNGIALWKKWSLTPVGASFPNSDACSSMCASYRTILGNGIWGPRCESPFSTGGNEMKGTVFGLLAFLLLLLLLFWPAAGISWKVSRWGKLRWISIQRCGPGNRYASQSNVKIEVLSYFQTSFCPIGLHRAPVFWVILLVPSFCLFIYLFVGLTCKSTGLLYLLPLNKHKKNSWNIICKWHEMQPIPQGKTEGEEKVKAGMLWLSV